MDSRAAQSSPFPARPIVLSPPPLENHKDGFAGTSNSSGSNVVNSIMMATSNPAASIDSDGSNSGGARPNMGNPPYHSQRQQSVGYNLQHEFETLNADLDLDLKSTDSRTSKLSAPQASGLSGSILQNQFVNPLLKDSVVSPLPNEGNVTQAGLGSLLNNHSTSFLPNRPQSVNDFGNIFKNQTQSSNFYAELLNFCDWIEHLNPQDTVTMMDYLCNNLPMDILFSLKSKLDQHLVGQSSTNLSQPTSYYNNMLSPYNQYPSDFSEMESLSISDDRTLYQPKPKFNSFKTYGGQSPAVGAGYGLKAPRPRSADPNIQKYPSYQPNALNRAKSPTAHLFEKTSFLQLAAAQSPGLQPQPNSEDSLDMSHAALKMGALATINSRVALDSNKKNYGHYHQVLQNDPTNRHLNSSSVPLGNQRPTAKISSSTPLKNQKKINSPSTTKTQEVYGSPSNVNSSSSGNLANSSSSMPSDVTNLEYLNNIPAWLKLLRLHKYTDCLKDTPWQQLIELDDIQLEDKGVKALGARRKLLKAFDVIKKARS